MLPSAFIPIPPCDVSDKNLSCVSLSEEGLVPEMSHGGIGIHFHGSIISCADSIFPFFTSASVQHLVFIMLRCSCSCNVFAKCICHIGLFSCEGCLCLMEILVSLLQKRQPLPLSPQNYPLHGSEVNGFHSAPTTYNHTPAINGEGIMGTGLFALTYQISILVVSIRFNPRGHLIFLFPLSKTT